jgi:hypothetical protein
MRTRSYDLHLKYTPRRDVHELFLPLLHTLFGRLKILLDPLRDPQSKN